MRRRMRRRRRRGVWWVKDREILNHTAIFQDLSIPHTYLGAQGFRQALLFSCLGPKPSSTEGVFLLFLRLLTFARTRAAARAPEARASGGSRLFPPPGSHVHCSSAARGKCLRETRRRQPPDATFCNSTHTGCARTSRPNAIAEHLHNGC